MKNIYIVMLSLILLFTVTASGVFASGKEYGQEISNRQVTAIKDILADPKGYDGKTVTIEGVISSECPSGCWLYVKVTDGNAEIYVDIAPGGFAIPQETGHRVLVEGKVVLKQTGPMIMGKGVEIN